VKLISKGRAKLGNLGMVGVTQGTTTLDPPSLAGTISATATPFTASGAALGDRVELYPPYDLQGITAQGYVSAPGTVTVVFSKSTAGTTDLASGTWGYEVWRRAW
jgi:hypothetical protein